MLESWLIPRAVPQSAFQKDKIVPVYCASVGRSALSGKTLEDLGYQTRRSRARNRAGLAAPHPPASRAPPSPASGTRGPETGIHPREAIGLYETAGFRPCGPFGPYAAMPADRIAGSQHRHAGCTSFLLNPEANHIIGTHRLANRDGRGECFFGRGCCPSSPRLRWTVAMRSGS